MHRCKYMSVLCMYLFQVVCELDEVECRARITKGNMHLYMFYMGTRDLHIIREYSYYARAITHVAYVIACVACVLAPIPT